MSFVGFSIAQAEQLGGQDQRLTAVEALASSKVAQTAYDAKVALLDAKDSEQDGRLGSVEALASSKVAQSAYDAKVAEHEGRLDAVEVLASGKVAQTAYDAKVAEHEGRLDAVEGRASALESDIGTRIQNEINAKVAQATFDALATELRDADSALTTALATKVAQTTQTAIDDAQNALISQKASIAGVNNALNSLVNSFNAEIIRLDGVDASNSSAIGAINGTIDNNIMPNLSSLNNYTNNLGGRVGDLESSRVLASAYTAKVEALEEFIAVFLQTYTITKPDNSTYSYTGSKQDLFQVALSSGQMAVVSGAPNASMVFRYKANASAGTATTQFSSDGSSWSNFEMPFPVTEGVEATITRFVPSGITHVRIANPGDNTVYAGPLAL